MADSNKTQAGETSTVPNSLQSLSLNHSKLTDPSYNTVNKYQTYRTPWVLT